MIRYSIRKSTKVPVNACLIPTRPVVLQQKTTKFAAKAKAKKHQKNKDGPKDSQVKKIRKTQR